MLKRRNHGRSGHSYYADRMPGRPPDELVKLPGVTTILDVQAKPALIKWAATTTANYAVDNWARLGRTPVSARLEELYRARYSVVNPLAKRGTEVHRLAERMITGQPVDVPEELRGHVESYGRFLDAFHPEPIAVELLIANRLVGYCGTADLVAHMPPLEYQGEKIPAGVWLLELKTSEKGIFPEAALQACGYQHGEVYAFPGDPEEHPLADLGIERAGGLSIRGDGFDLYPLDTGLDTWDYFQHLAWMHERQDDLRAWVGEAVEPPRRAA